MVATTDDKPIHSPLGASSAERWMNCAGSYTLLTKLAMPPSDEPDYRRDGTAAHEALAWLLQRPGMDAWEIIGDKHYDVEITAEMAEAIQVFLDRDREDLAGGDADVRTYIEYPIEKEGYPLFYGTLDRAIIWRTLKKIKIKDFKYGEGVMVEVEENPQCMYYGYGLLQDIIKEYGSLEGWTIELEIIQPRGFHPDGPIRTWPKEGETLDAEYIKDWGDSTLLPAMEVAQVELDFNAGKWCRFCPAKLVCPLMQSLFGAAMKANSREIKARTTDELARDFQSIAAVKQYIGALEDETYTRLFHGETHELIKLVPKKANRVYVQGEVKHNEVKYPSAEAFFKATIGAKAFTEPKLKSPADLEKVDAGVKKLVKEFAYTPMTGLKVTLASDKTPGVKVETTLNAFPNALDIANAE